MFLVECLSFGIWFLMGPLISVNYCVISVISWIFAPPLSLICVFPLSVSLFLLREPVSIPVSSSVRVRVPPAPFPSKKEGERAGESLLSRERVGASTICLSINLSIYQSFSLSSASLSLSVAHPCFGLLGPCGVHFGCQHRSKAAPRPER